MPNLPRLNNNNAMNSLTTIPEESVGHTD